MNPKPSSSMHRATSAGPRSILTPSASSRSADPDRLVLERFPCLATAHPAPAATSAAGVEMLNVAAPPPVPAVSTRSSRSTSTDAASRRIVRARPTSSATVSPLARSATRKAPACTSPALPSMTSSRTAEAWSAVRWVPEQTASIARVRMSLGIRPWNGARGRRGALPLVPCPLSAVCSFVGEEVAQYVPPLGGEHRLGMELDALRAQLTMPHPHHHVTEARGQLELRRKVGIGDERVIAAGSQRALEPAQDSLAVVLDLGILTVDWLAADGPAAERLDQRLVAEAHTQGRDSGLREAACRCDRNPGVGRRAGPR